MKRFIKFLLIIELTVSSNLIWANYYPYPIMIIHGRGDKASTWQQMRNFFRQYYPDNYPGLIKVVNDGTEKPIYTYSVSEAGQKAELWTKEIFGRNYGYKTGLIIDNNGYAIPDQNNNDPNYNPYFDISLSNTENLCWIEETKRNFLTQHVPPEININQLLTIKILTNSEKKIIGATYEQGTKTITINITDLPFFEKYNLIAHSAGAPISRRYITASTSHSDYPYKNDIWKLVTIGGVNAGSNWAIALDFANFYETWVGTALILVGGYALTINPLVGVNIVMSGFLYTAALPIAETLGAVKDIDNDLKANSKFVEDDLNGIKPDSVKYGTIICSGYEVPSEDDFNMLYFMLGTLPEAITLAWSTFGASLVPHTVFLLNFFYFHIGWEDGDAILTKNQQKGKRIIKQQGLEKEKTNNYIYNSNAIEVHGAHSRDAFWDMYKFNNEGYDGENEPGKDGEHFKALLALIEGFSILDVSNSNTLTAVKMEPDGCYVNIQKPEIHIDGSCDDYLIQWMGDNDRVRLRYDKYANVDEVVHLKNTEEGVFDYQRVGDVGRGWFSQKHTLQLGGENKIRVVAKNAADEESNHIARTYYSVGLRYPADEQKEEMGEAVVWYEKDKLTGDIAKKKFVVSVTDGNFPEYTVDITGKELAGEWPYLYSAKSRLIGNQVEGEHNRDIEGVTITANEIKFSIRNYFYRDGYIEIFGNADGAKYNSANKIFVKII